MNLQLDDKLALVTASTGGIGLAIATAIAREGARVIVNGRTDASVDGALGAIRAAVPEGRLERLVADNATEVGAHVSIERFADVDVLVNNLGIYEPVGFFDETDESWLRLFETNVMSGVRLSRYYLKRMLDRPFGRVIFIASEAAISPSPEMAHYSATKSMQLSISRSLAELTKGTAVTVNVVMPGSTKTEGVANLVAQIYPDLPPEDAERRFMRENRPTSLIERLLDPNEIANFVAYVASPLASGINGSALRVDGGLVVTVQGLKKGRRAADRATVRSEGQGERRRVPSDEAWCATPVEVREYVRRVEADLGRSRSELRTTELLAEEQRRRFERALAARDRQIRRLTDELALARERGALSSRNSSKPPSSDVAKRPKGLVRPPSAKRRGGQPGHSFHPRALVPAELVASVIDHKPERCSACEAELEGEDPAPLRHQIVDLPVPCPVVVEHRMHSLRCACGRTTKACLPEGVTASGFGPGVEGTVAMLGVGCRLSHRMIQAVMGDLFGVRMGLGTVPRLLARSSSSVAEAVEEARERVRWSEGVKNVDETGWYQRGADGTNEDARRAWLWVVTSEEATVFDVGLTRGAAAAKRMLGEVPVGTVVTDRYGGYRFIDVERRQLCWAHLYREWVRMSERAGGAGVLGRQLKSLTEKLFGLWGRYRDGTVTEAMWEAETFALRWRMKKLLERGAGVGVRKDERSGRTRTKNTCREVLKVEPAMWRFVADPAIGMTNNAAERALRHAVLWRRVSFGSQSAVGAEGAARLLTVVMTLKARGESAHAYLVEASRAAQEGRPGPTLLRREGASGQASTPGA